MFGSRFTARANFGRKEVCQRHVNGHQESTKRVGEFSGTLFVISCVGHDCTISNSYIIENGAKGHLAEPLGGGGLHFFLLRNLFRYHLLPSSGR
jgi:hypothetical protein